MKALVWSVLILLFLPAGFSEGQNRPQTDAQHEDAEQVKVLEEGAILLKSRKSQEAIRYFDKIIAFYEAKYRDSAEQIYCSQGMAETLLYLTKHANEKKTSAKVVSRVVCDGHLLKALALVELGRVGDARAVLEALTALSSLNSQYLSELGHVYLREKNWQKALEVYQAAEQAAQTAAPEALKQRYLSAAYRGAGYALIELDRLDEVEAKYNQSLAIDPSDKIAPHELQHIRQLRAKRAESNPYPR